MDREPLKKSLLIGVNYTGSKHELRGCHSDVENMAEFLSYRGYKKENQVVLRDDQRGPGYPSHTNMLRAMSWLVNTPGSINFLHYSGHGGQEPDQNRTTGYDDTICPVDFEEAGQINSTTLHQVLVSSLPPNSSLFIVLDCCHSGSAAELPFVYRTDDEGKISVMNNVKAGLNLVMEADRLLTGAYGLNSVTAAKQLLGDANNFCQGFRHQHHGPAGLEADTTGRDWSREQKFVTMYSGCRDEETSADAYIAGKNCGAMTFAFLETMKHNPDPSYVQTLQSTRTNLRNSDYAQVPQLSVGVQIDLNQPLRL
ncbi:Putative Caspase-like domain superfamily [Septoria linicola]|uniref:Caspase-like domain superfamily n=1 Tax=Septoria linicola TaxID=215465 RepID=A0A9Q9ATW3_9PEZI|nr:Putative Caspase-like domain superfamily [Septoria linicola]